MRLSSASRTRLFRKPRRHQHRHVPPFEGHQRAGPVVVRGPEGVGDLRAGPQPRPPRLGSSRGRVDGAGGEQDVAAWGRRGGVLRVGVGVALGAQRLRLPHRPLQHHALGCGVRNGVGLAVAHEHHLVEDLSFRVGEGPASHPPVVGGEIPGRDREALPWHDEDQQAALGQVARGLRQEGVLRPLVFGIKVIRRVEQQQAEGAVRNRRCEEVGGQGAVEHLLGLLRPVPVQLDAVGLDGNRVGPVEVLGQPLERVPRPRSRGRGCGGFPGPGGRSRWGCESVRRPGPPPGRESDSSPLWLVQRVSCRLSFHVWCRAPRQAAIARSLWRVSMPTTSPIATLRW